MSKYNFSFLLILCIYSIYSEDIKLEGEPISSKESTQNLKNAFDGDLSTEFTSPEKEGWVGLELSSPAKITKIGFAHLREEPKDYLLGIFQGANDRTFFDAFPLYMIKEEIEPKKLNFFEISCSQTFKYVRYVGPEGKNSPISEFEIYGNTDVNEDDVKEEKFYQPTNIPLFIINSENSEMPKGTDRETTINCNYIMISDGKINAKQTGNIKLRGNSSIKSEKKPFLIKLEKKTTFLDMPANAKKWILVPNMFDKTLLRNFLGFKMSFIFGLRFTPSCRFIDVIINGNYRGNYLICDKIEVSKERLDIAEMDETCIEEPEISGGYLIEGQGSVIKGDPNVFKTAQGISFTFKYPEYENLTEEQKKYITKKFDAVEAEILEGKADSIDLESFSRYFLLEDFGGNQDGIFNSFFIYKERGDDKLYFGPVWDFDLSFDNAQILYPTNEKKNFAYKYALSNGPSAKVVSKLLSIEVVLQKVKDIWIEMTNTVFTKEIIREFIDEQVEYINESQKLNFMKWDVLSSRQFMEAVCRGTFEAEVDYLKEYVENRFDIFGQIVLSATTESVLEEIKRRRPWDDNRDRDGQNQ